MYLQLIYKQWIKYLNIYGKTISSMKKSLATGSFFLA